MVISQLPSTLARVTITLLAAIDGLGLSLLVVLWSTKTRTTAESGCSSDTAARIPVTNDLPDVRERDGGPRPAPPAGGPRLSDVWVYNGRAYDLSEWISKHPGGAFFIGRTKNRDITAIVKSYHRDPAIVERILQRRYALGRDATPRDIHPKHNAPAFLFKDDFNSWRDTPKYRFDDPNDLLHRVKARLAEPALAARIKRMDTLFNAIVAVLAVGYFAVQGVRLVEPSWMPLWAFVIAMVLLRSSLAGFGHYALHRAQRGEPPR